MSEIERPQIQNPRNRLRFGLSSMVIGLFIFILGAKPQWFNLDASEAIGFIQMGVFSFGLVLICAGGTLSLDALWKSEARSIVADLGLRLAWTGLIVAILSALADMIGVGTRPFPEFQIFFGYWQARGVIAGELIMIVGFLMMIPFKPKEKD
ncbi:MAG: hypothetical protein HON98_05005 [Chloroflexi bacterium]|jgi:hypothetical protein|nr:hypothetical protein [Chloroflexota bacterium]MBT3670247.1 hypothetical protein [Chloroflexota bacterium]MBT4003156.1 hypothetical protein [Chloroflexota bacterium]MBT4306080.1 hypothetical protein [Chloroflexota bacterium]MBT4534459.1 hypothetical protein [Chloroflexota bacterium]